MAVFPMVRGGTGGGVTETELWSNSSPTSSFASQTVTLSQGISNFDSLRFYYHSTNSTSEDNLYVNVSVSDFGTIRSGFAYTSGSVDGIRGVRKNSDTVVQFDAAAKAQGTGSFDNYFLIPTKICGVK